MCGDGGIELNFCSMRFEHDDDDDGGGGGERKNNHANHSKSTHPFTQISFGKLKWFHLLSLLFVSVHHTNSHA